jgi:hypothetical protein
MKKVGIGNFLGESSQPRGCWQRLLLFGVAAALLGVDFVVFGFIASAFDASAEPFCP